MTPLLRWAGSKKQLLPELASIWEKKKFTKYIEPFVGSAALFYKIMPRKAVLGDANSALIDTYAQIKKNPEIVFKILSTYKIGKEEYLRVRGLVETELDPVESAARFVYLNRYCFNGLYRTNLQGRFNVPYGGDRTGRLPSLSDLQTHSLILKRVKLVVGDFESTLQFVDKGDFTFMDPPYSINSRRVFKEYGPKMFSENDIDRLKTILQKIDSRGAFFVVSYGDSKEGRDLGKIWNSRRVRTRRNIAGFSEDRRYAYEILISNLSL